MQGDLASRFKVRSARAIHPRAVGRLHRIIICRELSDADQIIKSEQVGTDPRLKNRTTGRICIYTRDHPCLSSMGGGSGAADAGFVCASRRPQRAGDANCRRCNSIAADAMPARSIGLVSPATVNGASLSEKNAGRLGLARFSVRSARAIHPRAVGRLHRVIICRESDNPIK